MHRIHPIDAIIEERCPKLMSNRFLWSAIKPVIFKIFKYKAAKDITDEMNALNI